MAGIQLAPGAWATADGQVILGGGGGGGGAPSGPAGGDLNGTYPNPGVDDGADGTAIHDDTAGEIAAITAKATPIGADYLLIEDSADSNNKKSITIGDLPAAAPAAHAASHENGGSDEISVAGLSGVLADNQNAIPADGLDTSAIHDDVAGEIAAITAKATPVAGDFLLIEDSAASNAKKSITIGDLPAPTLPDVEDLDTASTDTLAIFHPTGAGGVFWLPGALSRVTGFTGKGSTNTNILRFTTEVDSVGTGVTYNASATLGDSWAVAGTGIYAVSATITLGNEIGPYYLNAAASLSNTLDASHIRAASTMENVTGAQILNLCWVGLLNTGDDIWISGSGTPASSSTTNQVSVTRIA